MLDTFAAFMQGGGAFMWVILALWGIGLAICIERFKSLVSFDIDGSSFMNELTKFLIAGDIKGGIKICADTKSLLPKVLANGLKRATGKLSQVQNAIDATVLEVVQKVDKRLNYLTVLSNLSTLLGLLGTIFGLIDSFQAVGAADPSQKAQILSAGISKAMNTTALGLISAVSLIAAHSLLTSKAGKIISELDEFSIKLLDLLGTRDMNNNDLNVE